MGYMYTCTCICVYVHVCYNCVILFQFEGPAGERLCQACTMFASNQARAIKLLKELSKNPKFRKFTQVI